MTARTAGAGIADQASALRRPLLAVKLRVSERCRLRACVAAHGESLHPRKRSVTVQNETQNVQLGFGTVASRIRARMTGGARVHDVWSASGLLRRFPDSLVSFIRLNV